MGKPKCFYGWMIKEHIHSDGMVGKLARDMKHDSSRFTRGCSRHRNEAYMESVNPGCEMRRAFDAAWKEYERY
ncbi:MAG: hypothetical protein IKP40_10045 [Clostridia bacterium]|nr:hypothetical protein [Clostridia bacterium]